jgi:putative ABC transport system permease protein
MPDWRATVARRLKALDLPPGRHLDIVDEVSAYLQDRYDEFVASGQSPAEAQRLTLAHLDTDAFARELARIDLRPLPALPPLGTPRSTFMATLWQDLVYAVRSMSKAPVFTAIVLATLALGIGANAAIFSVADAVMLRPYAYPDLDRIIALNERTRAGQNMSVAWPTFQDWRAQNQVFESLGIYRSTVTNLTGADVPERLIGALASSDIFRTMGIQPLAGRALGADDDKPGAARVAVISERLWRRRFNADASLLGHTILLNNEPHTVVGIMPATMRFPSRLTDVWLPLGPAIATFPPSRGAHPGLYVIGKLKPGETLSSATTALDTIARRLEQQYPDTNKDVAVAMTAYYEQIVQNIRPTLLVLLGAVGFVLLIACANLANLMLARSERQQRDIAVRRALGADRRRIVQQLLTESLLLAVVGGLLGVSLAYWAVHLFVASGPTTIPRIDLVAIDGRVLGFAAFLSIVSGVLFGLLPALRASSPDVVSALKQGGRGSALAPSMRFRSALVILQVALALILLAGAGLMIRSFAKLAAIEPGFDPARVITMRLALPPAKYATVDQWLAFHEALVSNVSGIPGVDAAGLNSALPLEGGASEAGMVVEGRPLPPPGKPSTMCVFQTTSPDYLRAMGIRLVKGRFFTAHDNATSAAVAIVDENLVSRLFANEEPLGKRVGFEFSGTRDKPEIRWREIVGVVAHVRHYGLASEPPFVQVYTPLMQLPIYYRERRPAMALVARTTLPAEAVTASIRRAVSSIDRDIPVYGVQMMGTYVSQQTETPRLSVTLLASLGGLALTLAVIGIYGVVAYGVAQRTQEIGVRVALGATRSHVLRLVVGSATALVVAGVVIGLGSALAMASVIRTMLFEVSERDPLTLTTIAVLLVIVGIVAAIVPARRATRIDPIVALRES